MTCCGAGDIHEAKPDYYLHLNARILGQAEALGADDAADDLQRLHAQPAPGQQAPAQDAEELARVNGNLAQVGAATYSGGVEVRHLLWEVAEGEGYERFKQIAVRCLNGLKVAPFYGCQILRPTQDPGLRGSRPPAVARAADRGLRRRARSTTRPRSSAAASRSCWRARTSRWARRSSR